VTCAHRACTTLRPPKLSLSDSLRLELRLTLALIRQVRLLDGTLKAWFRDRDAGFIFTSESNDDGHAWTRPIRTVLPNNNKAIQVSPLPHAAWSGPALS
jgi:predicted neuraminidase